MQFWGVSAVISPPPNPEISGLVLRLCTCSMLGLLFPKGCIPTLLYVWVLGLTFPPMWRCYMSLHVEGQPCGELPELQHAHGLPRLCAQDFGALATNSSCPAHAYHPGHTGLPLGQGSSAFYAWSLSSPPWLGSMISELWLQSACNLGYFSRRRSFHVTRGKHGRDTHDEIRATVTRTCWPQFLLLLDVHLLRFT